MQLGVPCECAPDAVAAGELEGRCLPSDTMAAAVRFHQFADGCGTCWPTPREMFLTLEQ